MTVDILLATYNGEKYLREQLDSLLNQTYDDWRIIARDDGSSDQTNAILNEYQQKVNRIAGEGKFIILSHPQSHKVTHQSKNKKIIRNFGILLDWSKENDKADYAMFCDQDDIWHPDKIEKSLAAIHTLESASNKNTPCLVSSDYRIVDAAGKELHSSCFKLNGVNPKQQTFRNKLVRCTTPGCTIMMNRPLVELAAPIPVGAHMHDMWVQLLADAVGKYALVEEQTMDYRLHINNTVGSTHHLPLRRMADKVLHAVDDFFTQAEALGSRVGNRIYPEIQPDLTRFLQIAEMHRPIRGIYLKQEGFTRNSPIQDFALFGGARFRRDDERSKTFLT